VEAISGSGDSAMYPANDTGHQLRTTITVNISTGTGGAYNLEGTALVADSIETLIDQNYAVNGNIRSIIDPDPFIDSIKAALGSTTIPGGTSLDAATVAQIAALPNGTATVTQTVGTGAAARPVAITIKATQNP
jgi:hypothetical protein